VTGYPYIRFYAGAQLRAPNGQKVGTLCIIDYQPRPSFSKRDAKILRDLGRVISTLLIAKQPGAENLIKTPA
jgi:GAF domain-containing protein